MIINQHQSKVIHSGLCLFNSKVMTENTYGGYRSFLHPHRYTVT